MINKLQRLLYRLGIIAPIPLASTVIYMLQTGIITRNRIIALVISSLLLIYHFVFIWIAKKILAPISFTAENTPCEKDKEVLELLIAYAIPLLEWILNVSIFNLPKWFFPGIACLAVLIMLCVSNNTMPSPVYLFLGFHFHDVETPAGKNVTLMSRKKNYRNSNKLVAVKRLFDDFYIEV